MGAVVAVGDGVAVAVGVAVGVGVAVDGGTTPRGVHPGESQGVMTASCPRAATRTRSAAGLTGSISCRSRWSV